MKITLASGATAWLIGDPHIGRKFERGVPHHRRGERERSQFAKFVAELNTPDVDYNIMIGDLFEHPHVGKPVAVAAADAFLAAAERWPNTKFLAMAGNHDRARELNTVAAWETFTRMVDNRLDNLSTISTPQAREDVVLLPWQWGVPALEQLEHLTGLTGQTVVAHCDLQSYGGDDSHLYPTSALAALGLTDFYGGHYHLPGDYKVDGHIVHCTGSLEPFTHAEDPDGEIYATLTLAEATDGRDLSNKFVRLDLAPGEVVPEDLDCQALTTRSVKVEAEEVLPMADFDWKAIMDEALAGLTPEVSTFISERLVTE